MMITCLLFIGVYAFGFIFMLPQLFVNYKVLLLYLVIKYSLAFLLQLKSVAHLPWRAFMYKVGLLDRWTNRKDGPMDG